MIKFILLVVNKIRSRNFTYYKAIKILKTKFIISITAAIIAVTWIASSNVLATDVSIDLQGPQTPISPYIYGLQDLEYSPGPSHFPKPTIIRSGGDTWTTYNWENNASNAGYRGGNSSKGIDTLLGLPDSDEPADAVTRRITTAHNLGAAALITISINDYVAADKNGTVTEIATNTSTRWFQNKATKNSFLSMSPDKSDKFVYQDEFVNFIQQTFKDTLAQGKKIFYTLDNEPGLWNDTHKLLHPAKTTYAEMAERTKRFGTMIKKLAPQSLVFGLVAYGFRELINLQDAPDATGDTYVDFYLDTAKKLEASEGKRIIDVLDLHWYPDITVNGKPLIDSGSLEPSQSANPSKAEIEARVQAPRSLWDPTYIENSFITMDYYNGSTPIRLIPWLKEKIAAHYPGTKLAISEYNYGDGVHISDGIAQADVLGIFGREEVFAANLLRLIDPLKVPDSYTIGAFEMYLDYDGKGSTVGDLSLMVKNPDVARLSVYAMKSTKDQNVLYIVAINKTDTEIPLNVTLRDGRYKMATPYRLTSASVKPKATDSISITGNILSDRLPPLSVTTFVSTSSQDTNTTSIPSGSSETTTSQFNLNIEGPTLSGIELKQNKKARTFLKISLGENIFDRLLDSKVTIKTDLPKDAVTILPSTFNLTTVKNSKKVLITVQSLNKLEKIFQANPGTFTIKVIQDNQGVVSEKNIDIPIIIPN